MISVVQGPPGSGKTLYAVQLVYEALRDGKEVYTNVTFCPSWPALMAGRGWRKWAWTEDAIYQAALRLRPNLVAITSVSDLPTNVAPEGSRLVVVDEAQLEYNCRDSANRGSTWLRWFSQSRKAGCDVVLIAQDHQMIDKQLRLLAEQLITCWSLKRLSVPLLVFTLPIGQIVTWLVGPLFYRRCTFIGMKGLTLWRDISAVPRDIARLYDTTQMYLPQT